MQTDHFTFTGPTQEVPQVAKKWNWGAFFLGWIWGIGNNVWISFLSFVPFVGFIMHFVLGVKGGEWAWKNKQWQSVEHFQKVQRTWAWVGLGINAFFIFIIFLMLLLIFVIGILEGEQLDSTDRTAVYEEPLTVISNKLKPIELSGKDNQTESITLSKGFIIVEANHYGDDPFVVKLLDKDGEVIDYLFNEMSGYDGKRLMTIDEDGIYSFSIETDGSWDLEINQNPPENVKSAPHEFTGRKDDVVFIDIEGNKTARLHFTHDGENNFIVKLNEDDLLVNEIGEYDDSITKKFSKKGLYAFNVKADGNWSINVEYE